MSAPARPRLEDLGLSATCVEVLRHLWEYLDEELTPASAERLRNHIASCGQCKDYEGYQSCFLEALAKLKSDFAAPSDVREKIAERLKGEGCACWSRVRGG